MATLTQLMTVSQAAKKLGLCEAMVRRYCKNGRIPCQVAGNGMYLINPETIEMFSKIERKRGPKSHSEKITAK